MDGFKVFLKTIVVSKKSNKIFFFILPLYLFISGFLKLTFLPVSTYGGNIDFKYDILIIHVLTVFDTLVFIIAAWSSFSSKFPSISTLRQVAQLCAFELVGSFCLLSVISLSGTLSFRGCIDAQQAVWFVFLLIPYAFLFFVVILAETHRTPADFMEAESEVTAGYQTEFGGVIFSFFYLAEYLSIIVLSIVYTALFFGGNCLLFNLGKYSLTLFIKVVILLFIFVVIRATLPRLRIESGLLIAWTHLLPVASGILPFYIIVCYILKTIRPSEYSIINQFNPEIFDQYHFNFSFWIK